MPLRDTLHRKLMRALMATSLVVLAVTCTTFVGYEYLTFRRELVRGLATQAGIIAANSTAALAFRNESDARDVLSALGRDPHLVAAALYDEEGRPFVLYPADASASGLPSVERMPGHRFEANRLALRVPVAEGSRTLGSVLLVSDLGAQLERFRLYAVVVAAVIVASLGAAWLLANRLRDRIAAPILELARTARGVSDHADYGLRARHLSDDEIGELTDSFNAMLDRIEERDAALRRTEEEIRTLNAQLEERVAQRTADLEASNRELAAFSYSVSHDLRAPLRTLDGFSRILLEDYSDRLDLTARDYLGRLRAGSQRMAELIDDLLTLSRLTRAEMRRATVDLSGLARGIVADLRERDPDRRVDVRIEDGLVAEGDADLLRIALDNLLGNAWKFTSRRPDASIEVGRESVDGTAAFFVRDNGAGFDMAYVSKLFGAFQRLHRSDEFEGTGIGLATVARIIHRHGGQVWATGEIDAGATFRFTLSHPEGERPWKARESSSSKTTPTTKS